MKKIVFIFLFSVLLNCAFIGKSQTHFLVDPFYIELGELSPQEEVEFSFTVENWTNVGGSHYNFFEIYIQDYSIAAPWITGIEPLTFSLDQYGEIQVVTIYGTYDGVIGSQYFNIIVQDQFDEQAIITVHLTGIPPSGVEDYIEITSNPESFHESDNITFGAKFVDVPPTGHTCQDWALDVKLLTTDGEYEYITDEIIWPGDLSVSYTAPPLPTDKSFIRNEDGLVMGFFEIRGTDNTNITHIDFGDIGIYKEPNTGTLQFIVLSESSVKLKYDRTGGSDNYIYYGNTPGAPYDGTGITEGNSPINNLDKNSMTLTGLTPCLPYYFSGKAENSEGVTDYWEEKKVLVFETPDQQDLIFHNQEVVISTNINLTGNHLFSNDMVIQAGATVEINGGNLYFYENTGIVIEPGGELIVNGALITSPCGERWKGIDVWGVSDKHQYTLNNKCLQGKLVLNNSIIENAEVAVSLWKPGDYNATGGVVLAENSVFRNNAKSVHVLAYENYHPITPEKETDNVCSFKSCTFEITENYIPDQTFYKHVDLYDVKGVKFYDCDFKMKDVPGTADYNIGIASYSAGFRVLPLCYVEPCTNYEKCTFTGFWSGIFATDDMEKTFIVKHAEFMDNIYGVKVDNQNNFTILNSEFYIGHNPDKNSTCEAQDKAAAGYGIYSNASTGFAIEQNYFTKNTSAPTGIYIGTYIANTKAVDVVYENTYENLSFANRAEGQCHVDYGTTEGLAYYCNENSDNFQDFRVDKYNDEYGAIQGTIGMYDKAAGNSFTQFPDYNIYNNGNHVILYYYDNFEPKVNKDMVGAIPGGLNECQDHYGGITTDVVLSEARKLQIKANYASDSATYKTKKATYDSYTDGGDTDALTSAVETATPGDRNALRSSLLNISPFLSYDALMEVIERTDVFPDSTIFEILAANPDELRNGDLINYLGSKQNPLPSYMIDSLVKLSSTTTYKTELLSEIGTYAQLKAVSRNDILRSLLNDTISSNDELTEWITKEEGVRSDQQYIAALMSEQLFNKALAVADSMTLKYGYDANEIAEHDYYMDLLELQISLSEENRSIYDLDSTEYALVKNVADNSKDIAGIRARAIMGMVYNDHYCNCINADDASAYKNAQISVEENLSIEDQLNISVEPNPAKDWIAFKFELPKEVDKASIRIMDVSGKVIHTLKLEGNKDRKVWNTSHLKPGLYLYSCIVNGYSKSGKFMITN